MYCWSVELGTRTTLDQQDFSAYLSYFYHTDQSYNPFQNDKSLVLQTHKNQDLFGKGLMEYANQFFTKQHNFRYVQIEKLCRPQDKYNLKIEPYFGKSRLPAFLPFSYNVFKGFILRMFKS